ncbi:DUF1403 family protein [Mesorhizobium sp. M0185]|uniref:DUF1403 family protein n=1 Tax=Mesorhizobium sp. M0185 TaxID=2956907 RepID=UPI00333DC6EE
MPGSERTPGVRTRRGALEDIEFMAGAAIALLDAVVRRQEKWAGVWRQRLALSAAAMVAKRSGRAEDGVALRDAVTLTRPGDDVGPAGRLLLAWRKLAARPAESLLSDQAVVAAAERFGFSSDDVIGEIAAAARDLSANDGPAVAASARMLDTVAGLLPEAERSLGAWLADVVLARKLNWPVAVPLLGVQLFVTRSAAEREKSGRQQRSGPALGEEWRKQQCLAGLARAAIQAIDLSAELSRRAEMLLTVAPTLRAKGSDAVVERFLAEDAVVASDIIPGISDRGLRRLFDRLFDLGAVRELSGRSTFRIYGL